MASEREVPIASDKRAVSRLLISNSAWSLLTQIARVASLAVVMVALSRHLGPQRFGSLAFGLAFVRIFAVLAAFGLDRIIVQQLVQAPEARSSIVRKGFLLKLWIAIASYVVMFGLALLIGGSDRVALSIIALAGISLLFQCCDVFDFAFQAENAFRTGFFARALPVLAFAGVKVWAVLLDAPLLTFAALEALEAMAVAALLFCLYRSRQDSSRPISDIVGPRQRQLLVRGFPILLATLSVMIYMRSDILILGKLAGYKAAGIYSAAAQITEACTLLPIALMPALFPFIVRWRKKGEAFYHAQLEKLFAGAAVAGFCVTAILAVAAPLLVHTLYGADYSAAAGILVIHAWSGLFIYLAAMQSGYDIAEGLSWLTVLRTVVGAILNIALNLAWIPHYGGGGAAMATLVSQVFAGLVLNLAHPKTRLIFAMQVRALLMIPVLRAAIDCARGNGATVPQPVSAQS